MARTPSRSTLNPSCDYSVIGAGVRVTTDDDVVGERDDDSDCSTFLKRCRSLIVGGFGYGYRSDRTAGHDPLHLACPNTHQ